MFSKKSKKNNNSQPHVINLDAIGTVSFIKSNRAKHVNISIKNDEQIRVAVPWKMSYAQAERLVHERLDWIQKKLAKIRRLKQAHEALLAEKPVWRDSEAKKRIIFRLQKLAKEHGFTYNRVFIRHQKTRWGSCSSKNNINLNICLVYLPIHLFDYVVMHELVHTQIKNHGQEFWNELDRHLSGKAKQLDRQLRNYRIELLSRKP
ncbi:DUF45 domain-containing protein [candidate division KSB1 bacterium]|jgi:hypothetical protein|nr:DUF45 domain-containing protein [candidate division KSB1 bacterium]